MAIRQLRLYGDDVLKKTCRPVTEVNRHIRMLLDDMAETMAAEPGCAALAANQLGVLRRLLVIDTGDGVKKLINPVITDSGGEQDCLERCVSVKNIAGMTVRPRRVAVEALDENGSPVSITAEDAAAQLYCRGIDYLDGRIFVDHVYRYVDTDE